MALNNAVRRGEPQRLGLLLSAVEVRLKADAFTGSLAAYPGAEEFQRLRSDVADLFVYRISGRDEKTSLLVLPLGQSEAARDFPEPIQLAVKDHLGAIATLIERRLPLLLPQLQLAQTRFGLRRINHKDDLVDRAFATARINRPTKLAGVRKLQRVEFRVRVLSMGHEQPRPAMTIEFSRHFVIEPSVAEMLTRGFDLIGMWVIHESSERRFIGRILEADQKVVSVDTDEGPISLDPMTCKVEPSLASISTLFQQGLGDAQLSRYEEAEWNVQGDDLAGRGHLEKFNKVADYFKGRGVLEAAPTVAFEFGELINTSTYGRHPPATALAPVRYCFSSDRTALDEYPFRGLDRHGPFDNRTFDNKSPRFQVVCPDESKGELEEFVRRLIEGLAKDGQQRFARGLAGIYRLARVIPQFVTVSLSRSSAAGIGERYVEAIKNAFDPVRPPDIALVVVRDHEAFLPHDNPYLAAKAYLLSLGIPVQEIRLQTVRTRINNLPYILENLAVALYAKLGGSPWTVIPTMPLAREVILGMSHAEIGTRFSTRRRYMGITTVFNSEGTYLLAASSPRCRYEDYPAVLTRSIRDTLSRLSSDQGWQEGDIVRLVIHSRKPLKNTDVASVIKTAIAELGTKVAFETAIVTIKRDHPYKVLDPAESGREKYVELLSGGFGRRLVGTCVPARGVVVDLGPRKRLLCVNGTQLVRREKEPIPQPLLLELHGASTYRDMNALTRQVFHFTGMSWRSMQPITEPVTVYYSHLIAELLGKLDRLPGWSDNLLDTRLRRSRWFL